MTSEDRVIFGEVLVDANLQEVWDAWTTEDGAKTFFAPDCKIDLRPGGAYEMYFAPESPAGSRGGEGCQVMAIQRLEMFSFTWNAPPSLVEIRNQFTHVTIQYYQTADGTRVELFHDGWGIGAEWDKAFSYFDAAWNKVVLPRLKYRFTHGQIDWQNPPEH